MSIANELPIATGDQLDDNDYVVIVADGIARRVTLTEYNEKMIAVALALEDTVVLAQSELDSAVATTTLNANTASNAASADRKSVV